jgi:hypothetical protein
MKRGRPLIERGGQDWGPPCDGLAAIQALEQHRRAGISDLVCCLERVLVAGRVPGTGDPSSFAVRLVQHGPNTLIFDLR